MERIVTTRQERRQFIARIFQWFAAITALALTWPLFRFLNFTMPAKPRFVKISAPLPASGFHAERDFILFVDNDAPRAVSRICTHLGCRLNYLEDKQIIECPCHQSRFTTQGKLLAGPAKRDLARFSVAPQTDDSGVITGYMVTL